jgi:hypothetical protein
LAQIGSSGSRLYEQSRYGNADLLSNGKGFCMTKQSKGRSHASDLRKDDTRAKAIEKIKNETGIQLHPKFGLNPTLSVCFFCGDLKPEVAFLGNDIEEKAPKQMTLDTHPCEKCDASFNGHVVVVEIEPDNNGSPKPTGQWCMVRKEEFDITKPPAFNKKGHIENWLVLSRSDQPSAKVSKSSR